MYAIIKKQIDKKSFHFIFEKLQKMSFFRVFLLNWAN